MAEFWTCLSIISFPPCSLIVQSSVKSHLTVIQEHQNQPEFGLVWEKNHCCANRVCRSCFQRLCSQSGVAALYGKWCCFPTQPCVALRYHTAGVWYWNLSRLKLPCIRAFASVSFLFAASFASAKTACTADISLKSSSSANLCLSLSIWAILSFISRCPASCISYFSAYCPLFPFGWSPRFTEDQGGLPLPRSRDLKIGFWAHNLGFGSDMNPKIYV